MAQKTAAHDFALGHATRPSPNSVRSDVRDCPQPGHAKIASLFRLEDFVNSARKYLPTLDGWRALSVIGVILYHGRVSFFDQYSPPDKIGALVAKVASRGEIGVDVFFAISGFLICGLLVEEFGRTGTISLRQFYTRRCFRILPPYYAALAGIILASILAAVPVNLSDLPSCLLFYRNYLPLGIDYQGGYFTAHFWSLAVEEHFYLLWPVVLLWLKPRRAGWATLAVAMLVFAWRQAFPFLFPGTNYLSRTDTRIDGLLWGCLAAICFPEIKKIYERLNFSQLWMPLAAILLTVEALHLRGLMTLYVVLLPALVLSTVIQPNSLLGRVLEWRPLRWIGRLSYSLYLWQMLFLPVPSMQARGAFAELQRWPWNIVAMLACSVASRYLLEIPMTRLGHQLATSPITWTPALPIGRSSPERKAA
jgi:peptidoglycan/LPS O-acetylase OafA/YrhL